MTTIKGDYWHCYLEGRAEKLLRHDIDPPALAGELAGGGDFRAAVAAACARVVTPLEDGKTKQRWVTNYAELVKDCGGDADVAYAAFLQGRLDKLTAKVERLVLDALDEMFDVDGDDGEDEDKDDGDEDDDDDDE